MSARDELTAEDRSILAFVEMLLEQRSMSMALAMLRSERTKVKDLREVIEGFRELYRRQCQ
jgi:hypothetical protein